MGGWMSGTVSDRTGTNGPIDMSPQSQEACPRSFPGPPHTLAPVGAEFRLERAETWGGWLVSLPIPMPETEGLQEEGFPLQSSSPSKEQGQKLSPMSTAWRQPQLDYSTPHPMYQFCMSASPHDYRGDRS